jgi:hypothetical protein
MDAFETGALVTAIDDTAEPGAVGAAGLAALCPHADAIAPTAIIVAVVSAMTKPRPLRFDPGTSAMSVRSSNDRTQQVTSARVPYETDARGSAVEGKSIEVSRSVRFQADVRRPAEAGRYD